MSGTRCVEPSCSTRMRGLTSLPPCGPGFIRPPPHRGKSLIRKSASCMGSRLLSCEIWRLRRLPAPASLRGLTVWRRWSESISKSAWMPSLKRSTHLTPSTSRTSEGGRLPSRQRSAAWQTSGPGSPRQRSQADSSGTCRKRRRSAWDGRSRGLARWSKASRCRSMSPKRGSALSSRKRQTAAWPPRSSTEWSVSAGTVGRSLYSLAWDRPGTSGLRSRSPSELPTWPVSS